MARVLRSEARSEIVIGVVGPRDQVERIMLMQTEGANSGWRLVGSVHTREGEAYQRLRQIEDSIDVVLFGGPLQYDIARESGEIRVPATFVPVSGASLYSSLLRGVISGGCDPARVSIDSIAPREVEEAYQEIGVDTAGVHVHEYQRPESVREYFDFHHDLYKRGRTSAALTTVLTVHNSLKAAGVPVVRVAPTANTLRIALHTAALLGTGNKLEESQIAIAIVEVAQSARPGYAGPSNYWQQELKLSLHRALLAEARTMGATVQPRDEHGYVVTATFGAFAQATDGFRAAPFLTRIGASLGVAVEVGIGMGRTARDAEAHALVAVERSRAANGAAAFLVGADGELLSLPVRPHRTTADVEQSSSPKNLELLAKLVDALGTDAAGPIVVDAEAVAATLGVTPRSARRSLQGLVADGLAWPMPPAKSTQAGRPPRPYRLVTEKLAPKSA